MASSLNNASIGVSGFNDTGNNFFVTFYDVDKNAYINDTGNYTEVCDILISNNSLFF